MKVIALKNIILEKNTITYKFDIPKELENILIGNILMNIIKELYL